MHEYSIVGEIVERVGAEARARGGLAVHRLVVRIGALSGVEPELLARAYSLFREGTVCARAELCLEQVEARWACPGCGRRLELGEILSCGRCGLPARLEAGGEIILARIEMEAP